MRQFVAPTSFMIPISLRRANSPIRTVFAIRIAAETSITNEISSTPTGPGDREQAVQERALVHDPVDAGLPLQHGLDLRVLLWVLELHPERGGQRIAVHVVHERRLVGEQLLEVARLLALEVDILDDRQPVSVPLSSEPCRGSPGPSGTRPPRRCRRRLDHEAHLPADQQRQAEQQQRDERRRDRGERDQAVPPQPRCRLANRNSNRDTTRTPRAWSRTTLPLSSSIHAGASRRRSPGRGSP